MMRKFTLIITVLVLLIMTGCSKKTEDMRDSLTNEEFDIETPGKSFSYERNSESINTTDSYVLTEIHDSNVEYAVEDSLQQKIYIRVYELNGSAWKERETHGVSFTSPLKIRINGGSAESTAFYEVDEDSDLVISADVNEITVVIYVPLRLSGILTFSYLFTDTPVFTDGKALAGYVIVSDQRNVINGFDARYFSEPNLLPEGTYEIFAVELELN